MSTDTFAHIPLDKIVTSLTNPRKTFDPVRLHELADSIKASGVHQPVLVRPLPASRVQDTSHLDPRPTFELVSGERRYRASKIANAKTIPAMVRALTDDQVLEIQLVENLQRDDLQPLEEAEGYDLLMHRPEADGHPALTVDQLAAKIGKSRSYVYARLALLRLGPDGREALRLGKLDASRALLIARIPSTKLQADALGNIVDHRSGPLSVRDAAALIERQYMLRLSGATFKITDAELVPKAGSCRECPKRTGADPDLFADVKGADVCTDPPCFKAKADAHQERSLKAARESGAKIIEGREAKSLIPHSWGDGRIEGYLRLDNVVDSPNDKPLRKLIGKLMETEGITPTMVANPHKEGELIAVIDHATASRLLAKKGMQEQADALDAQAQESEKAAQEAQQRKDTERFENEWRWRVLTAAWAKIEGREAGMYSVPEQTVRYLARGRIPNNQEQCKRLCKLLGLGTVAPSAALHDWVKDHADPDRALALLVMFGDIEWRTWGYPEMRINQALLDLATDRGIEIDVEAVKAEVQAEHTEAIKARKKAKAEAQNPSVPLPPAAQAERGAGSGKPKGKGKKAPAAPAVPKTSEAEARTGIAAAMQSGEVGADDGPEGQDPAGCAGEPDGRATSPDAGADQASPLKAGDRVITRATSTKGYVSKSDEWGIRVRLEGSKSDASFTRDELVHVVDEIAWPFPQEARHG